MFTLRRFVRRGSASPAAPATPADPACRSATAATPPPPPVPTAPYSPAALRSHAAAERRQRLFRHVCGRHHHATSRLSSPTARASTTASRTAGCVASTASISPHSMRKPRIFTCWSLRPGTRCRRSPDNAPRRRCGTSARPARTDRSRSAPPSVQAGSGSPAPPAPRRYTARPPPQRHRLPVIVQQIDKRVGDRPPDRHRHPVRLPRTVPGGNVHRRLRRPIQVMQLRLRQPAVKLRHQRRRQRFPAAHHPHHRRSATPPARPPGSFAASTARSAAW